MPRTQFLHYDSASATYLKDNANTGANYSPFNANYAMNQTMRKIKKVYLKSLEMPVGFANVRKGVTDTLKFTINGTSYTVTLPEKN